MQNNTQKRWLIWKSNYISNQTNYFEDIWQNIEHHPLDHILDVLGDLLIDTYPIPRIEIENFIKEDPALSWKLILYIRRISLRINFVENKDNLLYKGIIIADLICKFEDPRDILISLILLNWVAQKIGADFDKQVAKISPIMITSRDSLFYQASHQTEKSIEITINMFGPKL